MAGYPYAGNFMAWVEGCNQKKAKWTKMTITRDTSTQGNETESEIEPIIKNMDKGKNSDKASNTSNSMSQNPTENDEDDETDDDDDSDEDDSSESEDESENEKTSAETK